MTIATKNLATVLVGLGLVLALSFAFALPASAATISDPLFSNGQTSIDATGGSTVNGTLTLTVGAGEVVEWLRFNSDTQPFNEASVGGQLGYQEGVYTNVPFSAKIAPNTGNFNVWGQGAGTFGGGRSINGADNVVVGPINLGMVRVVASGGSVGGLSQIDQLLAQINNLTLHLNCLAIQGSWDGTTNICSPKAVDTVPVKPAGCSMVVAFNGTNAWAAQTSLFGVDAGRAYFNANGVFAPTGNFKSISAGAAAAVAAACR